MKKYLLLIPLSLASAFLLTACGSDADDVTPNTPDTAERTPIYLSAALASPNAVTRGTADLQTTEFVKDYGYGVGVYIYRKGQTAAANPDSYGYTNLQYAVRGTTGDLTLATGTSQPYYSAQNTSVDVYAYAPFQGTSGAGTSFADQAVQTDQSTDAGYLQSDYVSGKANFAYNANPATKHEVTLNHRLSRIKVILKAGNGVTDADLQGAVISLLNVKNKFTFNPLTTTAADAATMASDAATATIKTGTTLAAGTSADGTLCTYAIIPPQTIASGTEFIQIVLSSANKTATYKMKLAADATFAAGNEYTYTITVDATAISFTTSIAAWGSTTAQNGTAVLQ
jgi:hypothetical protein